MDKPRIARTQEALADMIARGLLELRWEDSPDESKVAELRGLLDEFAPPRKGVYTPPPAQHFPQQLVCPSCTSQDSEVSILGVAMSEIQGAFYEDGTDDIVDQSTGKARWGEDSPAECLCGWKGRVCDLRRVKSDREESYEICSRRREEPDAE